MGKFKNFLKAGAIGTAIGSVISLLCTKKTGKETRDELKEKFEETRDKTVELAKKTIDEAKGIKQEVEKKFEKVKEIFCDCNKNKEE